jgi:hypothetical protein
MGSLFNRDQINQINDRNHIKQINQINQKDQTDHKVKDKDLTPKTLHKKRNLPRSGLLEKQVKANRDKYEHDRQG